MPPENSQQPEIIERKSLISIKEVLLIEALSIFVIISITMSITIWFDIVSKGYSKFNEGLLISILFNALKQTIYFVLGYSIVKKLYSFVRHGLHKSSIFLDKLNKKQIFTIHIFAAVVLIFSFGSVRPVIQRPVFSEDLTLISDVAVGFANYDFIHTIFALSVVTILGIIFLFAFNSDFSRNGLKNISVIFLIFSTFCTLNNYKDSFDEKILEARGYLNMSQEVSDFSLNSLEESKEQANIGKRVLDISNEALSLAKNDDEKALALRWVASGLSLQKESEKAYETIHESLRLDPQDYAYGELIYIAIDLKKYNEAIQAGKTCLNINPDAFYCYAPLAKAYWFMGDYEMAKETLLKADSTSPNSRVIHDILSYYETNTPVEISYYTPEQRELRKNNEAVNVCLFDVQEEYGELARDYCELEGQNRYCSNLTAEHGMELLSKVSVLRNDCFTKFATSPK